MLPSEDRCVRDNEKGCKTDEELAALAAENGIELSDEQLETLVGADNEWHCRCNQPGAYYCYDD